jgi:hypothetical protein
VERGRGGNCRKIEGEVPVLTRGRFRFFPLFGKIFGKFWLYVNMLEWESGDFIDINGKQDGTFGGESGTIFLFAALVVCGAAV